MGSAVDTEWLRGIEGARNIIGGIGVEKHDWACEQSAVIENHFQYCVETPNNYIFNSQNRFFI